MKKLITILIILNALAACANLDKRELQAPCASTDCGKSIPINLT